MYTVQNWGPACVCTVQCLHMQVGPNSCQLSPGGRQVAATGATPLALQCFLHPIATPSCTSSITSSITSSHSRSIFFSSMYPWSVVRGPWSVVRGPSVRTPS